MVEYADRAGLDPDVNRAFVQIMRWVDADKLKRQRDKNRGDQEDTAPESAPEGHPATMPTASKEAMLAAARRRAANVKKVVK